MSQSDRRKGSAGKSIPVSGPEQERSLTSLSMQYFDNDFNESHPAFQWVFQASNDWGSVEKWIPGMKHHLKELKSTLLSDANLASGSGSDATYSAMFRESFCVAAADLAKDLRESLTDLGGLHGGVIMARTVNPLLLPKTYCPKKLIFRERNHNHADEEANVAEKVLGKGQFIFLVSKADPSETLRLSNLGYKFVPLMKATEMLAENMQVSGSNLLNQLSAVKASCFNTGKKPGGGTFLALFALKADLSRKSWEVLVDKNQPSRLPMKPLWRPALSENHRDLIRRMSGLSVEQCHKLLKYNYGCLDNQLDCISRSLDRSLMDLWSLVGEPFFNKATLSAKIVKMPSYHAESGIRSWSNLVVLHIIPDVHEASLRYSQQRLKYTSLGLFNCLQQIELRGAYDITFHEHVDHEFSNLFAGNEAWMPPATLGSASSGEQKSHWQHLPLKIQKPLQKSTSIRSIRNHALASKSSSESQESNSSSSSDDAEGSASPPDSPTEAEDAVGRLATRIAHALTAGGSENEVVDVMEVIRMAENPALAESHLAERDLAERNFVDELFEIATAAWKRHAPGTLASP